VRIHEAIDGLATFFERRQTRAGVVARRLLGVSWSDDKLANHLVRERRSRTRLDGSIDGSLHATAWSAWELLRLGCSKGHTGLDRMVGFLLSRQGQSGRFGEGCSERRHEIATCNHFVSGFFSPGSRDEAVAPLALPTRRIIVTDITARFAVSCLALRSVLCAGEEKREPVRRHIESLLTLGDHWRTHKEEFPNTTDVVFSALGALGLAPPEYAEGVDQLATHVCKMQTADGAWDGTSVFHALDGLLTLRTPVARAAIGKALPHILGLQQSSGAFDDTDDEELAIIALRAIKTQAPAARATRSATQHP
jgi:hypothetical protein